MEENSIKANFTMSDESYIVMFIDDSRNSFNNYNTFPKKYALRR
jgi:hypothetical protein